MSVKVNIVSRQSNKLVANVTVNKFGNYLSQRGEIIIGSLAVYLKFEAPYEEAFFVYVMLDNLAKKNDSTIYTCKISSEKLRVANQKHICDDSKWRVLYEDHDQDFIASRISSSFSFDLKLEVGAMEMKSPFAVLYDDDILTDFELCGSDGSVRFHSAVLAVASPAFRGMLTGRWTETESRSLHLQETSKETLQNLKDYLYLDILPNDNVENLLLLASCYLMTPLELKCIDKLLATVTAESSCELMRFALAHNMMNLYYAFLKFVKDGGIFIDDKVMHPFNTAKQLEG